MSVMVPSDLYYDPFDPVIDADPYPVYRRLRDEAPLYYNERHDFYAVSRADDVDRVLLDHDTFISGRGGILDFIRANLTMPPALFIYTDPPSHTRYRKVLHGVFTPRRVAELEPKVRAFTARSLDAVMGTGRFDFMVDLGTRVPMQTIGMLLGIPESEQDSHRKDTDKALRAETRRAAEAHRELRRRSQFRRIHRLARRTPLRRSDDRSAQRRVGRGGRDDPATDP